MTVLTTRPSANGHSSSPGAARSTVSSRGPPGRAARSRSGATRDGPGSRGARSRIQSKNDVGCAAVVVDLLSTRRQPEAGTSGWRPRRTNSGWTPTLGRSDARGPHGAKPLNQVIEQQHLAVEGADEHDPPSHAALSGYRAGHVSHAIVGRCERDGVGLRIHRGHPPRRVLRSGGGRRADSATPPPADRPRDQRQASRLRCRCTTSCAVAHGGREQQAVVADGEREEHEVPRATESARRRAPMFRRPPLTHVQSSRSRHQVPDAGLNGSGSTLAGSSGPERGHHVPRPR